MPPSGSTDTADRSRTRDLNRQSTVRRARKPVLHKHRQEMSRAPFMIHPASLEKPARKLDR